MGADELGVSLAPCKILPFQPCLYLPPSHKRPQGDVEAAILAVDGSAGEAGSSRPDIDSILKDEQPSFLNKSRVRGMSWRDRPLLQTNLE